MGSKKLTTGEKKSPLKKKPIPPTQILKISTQPAQPTEKPNIILHLKCSLKDLAGTCDQYTYNPIIPPEIVAYNKNDASYFVLNNNINASTEIAPMHGGGGSCGGNVCATTTLCGLCKTKITGVDAHETNENDIRAKLKKLKIMLYKNTEIEDKQSACFWCTCDFQNPPCFIPKYEIDNSIHVYGSFCTPECAAGFLLFEEIDDSTKFERLYLLNYIYGKIYGYKKNIRPAPKPFYLLSKFFGNLSAEEFRTLSRPPNQEKQLIIIDRPLTRILPELHDEKDKSITNTTCSGIFRVKRQSDCMGKQAKLNILKDTFGFEL
jgi:hypothetical protein